MDLIQELEQKYGYSKEILEVLDKIIPAMKEYYGKGSESLIDEAILNCEIHVKGEKEDEAKFLQDFFGDKNEKKTPVQATAYYSSKLVKTDDGLKPKRLIYIKSGEDLKTDKHIATLVHEICHLVKGYRNEFTVDGNSVIKRTGIGREIYQIDENGNMVMTESENDGIEEALNIYDEEQITSLILGREYFSGNYPDIANVTRKVMQNPRYKNAFRDALMSGNRRDLKGISEEEFDRIDNMYNNIYSTYFPSWKEIMTKEGRESIKARRQENIERLRQETSKEERTDNLIASLQGLVKDEMDLSSQTRPEDKQIEDKQYGE